MSSTSNANGKVSEIRADSLLTSYQVGALLQVNPSSVNKWVKDGRIHAFRTPGGHRRIRAGDLVAFLHQHKMPVPPVLQQAARRRLLIADEDGRHLEALLRGLQTYGDRLEVNSVSNAIDALVQIGSFRPHLILIDLRLHGADGLEICRRLHIGADTRGIEVIIAHSELNPTLERQAADAGAKLCLRKPVVLEALLAQLLPAAAGEA